MEDLMIISYPAGISAKEIAWDATPLGVDIPFNVLTYSYGVALLASIIYVGGFFAKGFTHEITKGTIKTLFFGPISVTTMVFSKILYPIIIGPLFIFPLVFLSLSRFNRPPNEVLLITFVAYAMAVVTMAAAAYGSCIIYAVTKRMSIKPSVMSRIFLYLSLVATTTVFWWTAYILENWTKSTLWKELNNSYGGIASLSPFHQGGVYLSHALLGTAQLPDLWTFALPAVIIALGIVASRKLYSDIFSRE
jgi:ABC-type transport system involved in multi-copper enzyme maturation permease subunit